MSWITSCELDRSVWITSCEVLGARLWRSGSSVTLRVGTVVVVVVFWTFDGRHRRPELEAQKNAACPQGPQTVSNEEPGRREGAG